ncbi:DUF1800 domain-containing protein [Portibacter lacus]|uniref:DUF1800 domain-containing protein n=1 Tax=Portibacter lacus TaxID=1099794 RepID=A0AA37WCX7_9BACT|nr:DUF1800 family protein [Portibacter lacus]GLR17201.1 hypothetical protein GCM10007940_18160 [Portibacter lacus]
MNPDNINPKRDAFLDKMRKKFNVKDPILNFTTASTRNPEKPTFDPKKMSLDNYQGPWEKEQITHLIRRLKFGLTKQDLTDFSAMTMEEAVDTLLTEGPQHDPPVNDYNDGGEINDPDVEFGKTWVNKVGPTDYDGERLMSLKRYWLDNILNQGHSITEKMLLFWHNHLVTQWWGVFYGKASYDYLELLRKFHMGDIKELVKQMTIDVSMLYYLNGASSYKDAPDENYARELQELFTIGKGPNANYTEGDVRMAAKVLTGWTVTWPGRAFAYEEWRHDETDKQFSEFYGNRVIAGRGGQEGKEELDDLIDMIFDNNECALFLCRKIYSFFVYPEIDADVEEKIIVPLANLLRESNYVVKPVLDKLFKSEHFYDLNVKGSVIKDPVNHLLGLWRTLDPPVPSNFSALDKAEMKTAMIWSMHNIGMQIGDPPNVAGWQAYYQAPNFDKGWITTNTITGRGLHTDSLVYWGFWNPKEPIPADFIKFAETLDSPEDPNQLIDQITLLLFGLDINEASKGRLKSVLLSGQSEDYYWTNAWFEYQNNPTEDSRRIIEDRLKWMMQRVLQYAEYQLM